MGDPEETGAVAAPTTTLSPARRIRTWLGLIAVVGVAIIGSNVFAVRDHLFGSAAPAPSRPAPSRVAGTTPADTPAAAATSIRSQPWWQEISTRDGTGPATLSPFTVDSTAIQWRVKWTCTTGHLLVMSPDQPKLRPSKSLIDAACPEGEPGYGTRHGPISLAITADGPWHLEIAQEIDTPLVEPPLPAMTAPGTAVVAKGTFYNVDKTGTGRLTLYRQADGRYSLRLSDFFVSPSVDLQLRLSILEDPHSSKEFMDAQSELVATMDVTAGSLNYTVAASVDPTKFRSIVIWCQLTSSAYAASTLVPVR